MAQHSPKHAEKNGYALKTVDVTLIQEPDSSVARCSLEHLEEMRIGQLAVPASKHGIETICGGSCETGAQ